MEIRYQLLTLIIKELQEEKQGYQYSAKGLMLSLYIEIYRIQSQEDGKMERGGFSESASPLSIAPALDYIENNYMKQFSMEFLADWIHPPGIFQNRHTLRLLLIRLQHPAPVLPR